ncbi:MAG: Permease, drug/metabolite transporter (DMT) superfamily [Candidatus Roizmanbacteria bacterium GW2011_GWA2_32_13]|uniref:Permease, drug/metabolite transporter (DMT) superfamily n=1 Tax=Candidatus Roizmanbacteria bacterium GW2011_GWA2_32_13 TaxID=1618475 RepID=A0A0G0C003_9BACT|nr:MAG: Permease, drug/metabolite transporter (DMT) superfamily [Candidatus Roizmanbacteria bacterium GW2011_GWA2_32_13]
MIGLIYIIIAQFFWASEIILIRKFFPNVNSLFLSAIGSIIGSIFYLPIIFVSKTKLSSMSSKEIVILVIYSLTSWFLAQIFYVVGIQKGTTAFIITLSTLSMPIFAIIMGTIFLKEVITIKAIIGGILMMIGFLLVSIK